MLRDRWWRERLSAALTSSMSSGRSSLSRRVRSSQQSPPSRRRFLQRRGPEGHSRVIDICIGRRGKDAHADREECARLA